MYVSFKIPGESREHHVQELLRRLQGVEEAFCRLLEPPAQDGTPVITGQMHFTGDVVDASLVADYLDIGPLEFVITRVACIHHPSASPVSAAESEGFDPGPAGDGVNAPDGLAVEDEDDTLPCGCAADYCTHVEDGLPPSDDELSVEAARFERMGERLAAQLPPQRKCPGCGLGSGDKGSGCALCRPEQWG